MKKPVHFQKFARNRRAARTERQGAGGISKFLFWGEDLSGSFQGAGGVGGLVAHMEKPDSAGWTAYYYHPDANGNIAAVTSPFRALAAKFSYDAFGRTTSQSGPKSGIDIHALNYRFSTKPMELELATSNTTLVPPPASSGLYYYGYRFYSPNMGRWINKDPIREDGGMNLYGMVGNNLENNLDINGLKFCHRERIDYTLGEWDFSLWNIKGKFSVSIRGQLTTCDDCTRELAGRLTGQVSGEIPLWTIPGFTLSGTFSGEMHGQVGVKWKVKEDEIYDVDGSGSLRLSGWGGLSGGNSLAKLGGDIGLSSSWDLSANTDYGGVRIDAKGSAVNFNARVRFSLNLGLSKWKYNNEIFRYSAEIGKAPDFSFQLQDTKIITAY